MRPGRVEFKISYTVDLDNEAMVTEAKDAIIEDIFDNIVDKVYGQIKIVHDKTAKEEDIPEFLLGE